MHLVMPKVLQKKIIAQNCHNLWHSKCTHLDKNINATMYWKMMYRDIREHVKNIPLASMRRSDNWSLTAKDAIVTLWKYLFVDIMGLFIFKENNNISYKFMCITIAYPAMGMLEIEEIPTIVSLDKMITTHGFFDKMSAQISRYLLSMVSHYTQCRYVMYKIKSLFCFHKQSI